jgi:uncharacterized protein (TIGR03083 family)
MDPADMLAQLASDGAALRSAAVYHLDEPVPTCPGWTVRDAVMHTAQVYDHKATIIEGSLGGPPDPWPPAYDVDDLLEFFDQKLHRVIEALRSPDPDAGVWTWYEPDQSVGFWVRRMMQETVIHRADVESAAGPPTRIDPEVAVDGIDELVERMLCYDTEAYAEAGVGAGQRVVIEAGGSAWAVTLGPEAATFSREVPGDTDALIGGEPSEVLLALWNRLPYEAVTTTGDAGALASLRAAVVATTQ